MLRPPTIDHMTTHHAFIIQITKCHGVDSIMITYPIITVQITDDHVIKIENTSHELFVTCRQ